MLQQRGNLGSSLPIGELLELIATANRLQMLPITPAIAATRHSDRFTHWNPVDRLIASTALVHGAPLITRNDKLKALPGLNTIW